MRPNFDPFYLNLLVSHLPQLSKPDKYSPSTQQTLSFLNITTAICHFLSCTFKVHFLVSLIILPSTIRHHPSFILPSRLLSRPNTSVPLLLFIKHVLTLFPSNKTSNYISIVFAKVIMQFLSLQKSGSIAPEKNRRDGISWFAYYEIS